MGDPFLEIDEALLKVIQVVRDRIVRGEVRRDEILGLLGLIEERIRSLVETAAAVQPGASLSLHERRKLARGLGSRVDRARSALNELLETYFSEEMDRPERPQ